MIGPRKKAQPSRIGSALALHQSEIIVPSLAFLSVPGLFLACFLHWQSVRFAASVFDIVGNFALGNRLLLYGRPLSELLGLADSP